MTTLNNPPTRYDRLTMSLHWLTAVLVIFLFASSQIWDQLAKGTPLRKGLQSVHISCGILLAVIVIGRLLWRLSRGRRLPALNQGLMNIAAKTAHLALYLLLLSQIVLGFLFRWAQAEPFNFFGLFDVPTLMTFDKSMKSVFGGLHEQVAWALVILAGLHAVMALVHHYGLRDGTLRRMLPGSDSI
ncbi:cytochrome b [Pseudomonas sp. 10S4]|uniref:cytochrome b n=1 Tax=Pseudomonas sp. 10S4 TaxID=3048583 RepID=UPI002AC8F218|nr:MULTISPECIES: cytochrome b [unclassified Pseudomonas]MEB0229067.1 cytochrome b [Pseudomonas sp. 5S1]MEB0298240.1 cytochrome b [Pseudomonas sp. 10S4]WPX17104.1 cytochrome b [Pseudomonas sp. 10S4]